ncbi:flagellar biosynthesis protein FlgB [Nocardioides anomalus]|uniref:Flagellar basal body rod protein FlgB n=1 Tax=Nocardioides anomalus TaxID=2712223 RepID=A0A6G6WBQ3_9ACTN|nr:flagellar basal body protein [Nocardioides anomalus]QIG42470.1 flagellar biosynthesis protein FlgB [Nocardioides anomalus]
MSVPALGGLSGGSGSVLNVLATALDGLTTRSEVIADNIANVDTPGFRASTVEFESSLRDAVAKGDAPTLDPEVLAVQSPVGPNGNNVDLRKELMAASQTQFSYQLMTRAVSDQFALLSTAVGA